MPKLGARVMLFFGPLVVAAGFVLLGFAGGHVDYWTAYLPAIVIVGLGMGIAVAPLTTTAIDAADADRMGVASGINNAVSRVAGMLAIAGLGALVLMTFSTGLQRSLTAVGVPPSIVRAVMDERASLAATAAPPDSDAATKVQVRRAVHGAYLASYRLAMYVCAGLAAVGALVAVATVASRRASKPVRPIA
jgi:MFS family permease